MTDFLNWLLLKRREAEMVSETLAEHGSYAYAARYQDRAAALGDAAAELARVMAETEAETEAGGAA